MDTMLMLADKRNLRTRKRMLKLTKNGSILVRLKDNWLGNMYSEALDMERLNKCYLP